MSKCSVKYEIAILQGIDLKKISHDCSLPVEREDKCILHLDDPDKDRTRFDEALNEKLNDGDFDFSHIVFPKSTFRFTKKFRTATFFEKAKFYGPVKFNGCHFGGYTSFRDAIFLDDADFGAIDIYRKLTAFQDEVIFINATFHRKAIFRACVFGKSDWTGTKFLGKANFALAKLREDLTFYQTEFIGETCIDVRVGPMVERKLAINFAHCNMSGVMFTTIPFDEFKVEFKEIAEWYRGLRPSKYSRIQIRDEDSGQIEAARLQKVYRWLENYFFEQIDWILAKEFYIGLMHVRGSDPKNTHTGRALNKLYKELSGYGTSILSPLLIVVGVWLVVPIILLQLGTSVEAVRAIDGGFEVIEREYDFRFADSIEDWSKFGSDYASVFLANIAFSTIDRRNLLAPTTGTWQHSVVLLETLIQIILLPLLVIALRRQFSLKKLTGM